MDSWWTFFAVGFLAQLVDPVTGDLRIIVHRGHSEEFVHFFDRVGESGSACAEASRQAGCRHRERLPKRIPSASPRRSRVSVPSETS